jgi:hypothetical protein
MKRILGCLGIIVATIAVMSLGLLALVALIFHNSYPLQPKLGYTGDWRVYSELGIEERKLPRAKDVWRDYGSWTPKNPHELRFYIGHLGGADRQSNFRSWHSRGDTPMGAQDYTNVEFLYQDPLHGAYKISWTMRGKYEVDFLKFDNRRRLYQLMPFGNTNDFPPQLSIYGIEGIRPEFVFPKPPTNSYTLPAKEIEALRDAALTDQEPK